MQGLCRQFVLSGGHGEENVETVCSGGIGPRRAGAEVLQADLGPGDHCAGRVEDRSLQTADCVLGLERNGNRSAEEQGCPSDQQAVFAHRQHGRPPSV